MQVMIFPDILSIFPLDHLALSTFLAVVMVDLLKFNKEVQLVDPLLCTCGRGTVHVYDL